MPPSYHSRAELIHVIAYCNNFFRNGYQGTNVGQGKYHKEPLLCNYIDIFRRVLVSGRIWITVLNVCFDSGGGPFFLFHSIRHKLKLKSYI